MPSLETLERLALEANNADAACDGFYRAEQLQGEPRRAALKAAYASRVNALTHSVNYYTALIAARPELIGLPGVLTALQNAHASYLQGLAKN